MNRKCSSNYLDDWFVVSVIFQSENEVFSLLKCQHLLVFCDIKLNIVGFWAAGWKRQAIAGCFGKIWEFQTIFVSKIKLVADSFFCPSTNWAVIACITYFLIYTFPTAYVDVELGGSRLAKVACVPFYLLKHPPPPPPALLGGAWVIPKPSRIYNLPIVVLVCPRYPHNFLNWNTSTGWHPAGKALHPDPKGETQTSSKGFWVLALTISFFRGTTERTTGEQWTSGESTAFFQRIFFSHPNYLKDDIAVFCIMFLKCYKWSCLALNAISFALNQRTSSKGCHAGFSLMYLLGS